MPWVSGTFPSLNQVTKFRKILSDCLELRSEFKEVRFEFVRRDGNEVAHALAQIAQQLDFSVPTVWLDYIHHSVYSLIVKDLRNE